jgi:hypothetical protein
MGLLVDVEPPTGFDPSDDEALMVCLVRDNANPSVALDVTEGTVVTVLRKGADVLFDSNTGRFYSVGSNIRYRDTSAVVKTPDIRSELVGVVLRAATYGETVRVKFAGMARAYVSGTASATYTRGTPIVLPSSVTTNRGAFILTEALGGTQKVYGWLADSDVTLDSSATAVLAKVMLFGISGIAADGG